jgi:uncharacterized OB-fold protein
VARIIPPVANRDDAFFWESAKDGELVAHECINCRVLQHPPAPMCPTCGSVEFSIQKLSGEGTIYSWIVSKHPGKVDDPGRVVAVVELKEGIRIVSNIVDVEVGEVDNGLPVSLVFNVFDDVVLPQFRLSGKEKA